MDMTLWAGGATLSLLPPPSARQGRLWLKPLPPQPKMGRGQARLRAGSQGSCKETDGEVEWWGLASTSPPGELEVADGEAESRALEGGRPVCEL